MDTIFVGIKGTVVAIDRSTGKTLWKTDLKGLGPIAHSKYRNAVRLEVLDGDAIQVFGKESSGRYVEIVSRHAASEDADLTEIVSDSFHDVRGDVLLDLDLHQRMVR